MDTNYDSLEFNKNGHNTIKCTLYVRSIVLLHLRDELLFSS